MNAARIDAASAACAAAGADALLVTDPANILYISGFAGSTARLILSGGQLYFMTDFRYSRSVAPLAKTWPRGSQLIEISGSYDDGLDAVIATLGTRRLAFEAAHVSVADHARWTSRFAGVALIPTYGAIEAARLVKDASELAVLADAGQRVSGVARALPQWVRIGRRERDIAADVNYALARAGFSRPAFETIVASGPHAAQPHARPTDRVVARGDLVIVDFGGVLDGYAVDVTRTLSAGPPSAKARALHAAVLEAQTAAAGMLKPGVGVHEVDVAARRVLEERGFGEAIRHSTGHGLGLAVHEGPRLSRDAPRETPPLAAGMVVTIEPGAYLEPGDGAEQGAMGARIEDDLVVAAGTPVWLTDAPRELIEIT